MNILESLTKEAESLSVKNDWGQECLRINTQIIAVDSKNLGAYSRLGFYFFSVENYVAAREMFASVLQIDKADRIAKNKLKEVLDILLEDEIDVDDICLHVEDINNYFEALALGIALQLQKKTDASMKFIKRSSVLGKPRRSSN